MKYLFELARIQVGGCQPLSIWSRVLPLSLQTFHGPREDFRWSISALKKNPHRGNLGARQRTGSVCVHGSRSAIGQRLELTGPPICPAGLPDAPEEHGGVNEEESPVDLQLPPGGGRARAYRWAHGAAARAAGTSSGETQEQQVPRWSEEEASLFSHAVSTPPACLCKDYMPLTSLPNWFLVDTIFFPDSEWL